MAQDRKCLIGWRRLSSSGCCRLSPGIPARASGCDLLCGGLTTWGGLPLRCCFGAASDTEQGLRPNAWSGQCGCHRGAICLAVCWGTLMWGLFLGHRKFSEVSLLASLQGTGFPGAENRNKDKFLLSPSVGFFVLFCFLRYSQQPHVAPPSPDTLSEDGSFWSSKGVWRALPGCLNWRGDPGIQLLPQTLADPGVRCPVSSTPRACEPGALGSTHGVLRALLTARGVSFLW